MDRGGTSGGRETARRFRRGERDEVHRVREFVRKVIAFRGYGIPRQDREDLEQEVIAQLWRALPAADSMAGGEFWGLAKVIAVRRCIDWLRTRKTEIPIDGAWRAGGPDPLETSLLRERIRQAAVALGRLERPCRELIRLRVGLDKSYREISGLLGKSPGALRIQMYRCVRSLQRILEQRPAAPVEAEQGS